MGFESQQTLWLRLNVRMHMTVKEPILMAWAQGLEEIFGSLACGSIGVMYSSIGLDHRLVHMVGRGVSF